MSSSNTSKGSNSRNNVGPGLGVVTSSTVTGSSASINESSTANRSPRKRKRPELDDGEAFKVLHAVNTKSSKVKVTACAKKETVEVLLSHIRPPPLAFPKSAYKDFEPSKPRNSETSVLCEIRTDEEGGNGTLSEDDDTFLEADLEEFCIYRPHKTRRSYRHKRVDEAVLANELTSLHEVNEWTVSFLCFDGVISNGTRRTYIQNVPFETLAIGGYQDLDRPTVGPDLWLQSYEGQKAGVWYRLKTPAPEYQRYHDPFLWMADLAKHVVDFLSVQLQVALIHFREQFYTWLQRLYGHDAHVGKWLDYSSKDFRGIIAAHANFLFCQATQVDERLRDHPVWKEIHPRLLSSVEEQSERNANSEMYATSHQDSKTLLRRKTTVTPYVYECFRHLPWAKFLYCQAPSARTGRFSTTKAPGPSADPRFNTNLPKSNMAAPIVAPTEPELSKIQVGDVVALPRDKVSVWKTDDTAWYGYVQGIRVTKASCTLQLLWLYRPSDTECRRMRYPFGKELFLSNHCNCGDSPILIQEVTHKPRVAFFGTPDTKDMDFFVRQRYIQGDASWESLKASDFQCGCYRKKDGVIRYSIGDTWLVRIGGALEPIVVDEDTPNDTNGKMRVRRLLRRVDYGHRNAEPNELVFTNKFQFISRTNFHRKCHIRFYTEEDKAEGNIPPPYCRGGTGDHYFITLEDVEYSKSGPKPFTTPCLSLLNQGWDPSSKSTQPPMRGLDLFCGGGNLGRGLEEGGAVRFEWAVDWYSEAIHTYKANMTDQHAVRLFRGSVNDYLTQTLEGNGRGLVAQYGEVDVVCAGSPCPGFSTANPNKSNDKGLFDASMVASVVAFVDFYRPSYALMENVKGMASGQDTNNTLAQVICALLGMGYQVRTFNLDAWNFGSPQSRSRVFISIAAPGMVPMPEPAHTHSHPETVRSASLGKTPNGLYTSSRYTTLTPFSYVSASEATRDLPRIDARTSCIPFPDHRMPAPLSTLSRVRIASIPKYPGGSSFMSAFARGYMPQAQVDSFVWENPIKTRKDSKCWSRVKRNALMPTVQTGARPWDGAGGTCLHWDDDRLLTVMEVRRSQGIPDHEILVGLPSDQWKIIGNGVARPVALALGLSLRTAWLGKSVSGESVIDTIRTTSSKPIEDLYPDELPMAPDLAGVDDNGPSNLLHAKNVQRRMVPIPTASKATGSTPGDLARRVSPVDSRIESSHELVTQDQHYSTHISWEESHHRSSRHPSPLTLRPSKTVTQETTVSRVKVTYYDPL